jgi:hypothetical protein
MKKATRLVLATLSTLLLAAGFSRASEKIDPMTAATSRDIVHDQASRTGCDLCLPCIFCDFTPGSRD